MRATLRSPRRPASSDSLRADPWDHSRRSRWTFWPHRMCAFGATLQRLSSMDSRRPDTRWCRFINPTLREALCAAREHNCTRITRPKC
jgi:hypothetical protein